MALSLFTTRELMETTALLPPPPRFIIDTFFPGRHISTAKAIDMDKVSEDRKVAAYVSPKVATHAGEKESRRLEEYVPPSVIEMDAIDEEDLTTRLPGEDLFRPMSPDERHSAIIQRWRAIHLNRIWRRIILQGVEVMRTGKVTVSGKNHPADVIDYSRNSGLTIVLSGSDTWDAAGVDPFDDVEDVSMAVTEAGDGAVVTTLVMDPKAWRLFRKSAKVQAYLNLTRLAPVDIETGPAAIGRGARYMGRIGDFDVWVYADTYVDAAGATKPYLPDYTVLFGGPDIQGTVAFGAVAVKTPDGRMAMQPGEVVPDNFSSDNPVGEFIRDQSRPLVIPVKVNATACLTVKS